MRFERCPHGGVDTHSQRQEPVHADGVARHAKRQYDERDEFSVTHNPLYQYG